MDPPRQHRRNAATAPFLPPRTSSPSHVAMESQIRDAAAAPFVLDVAAAQEFLNAAAARQFGPAPVPEDFGTAAANHATSFVRQQMSTAGAREKKDAAARLRKGTTAGLRKGAFAGQKKDQPVAASVSIEEGLNSTDGSPRFTCSPRFSSLNSSPTTSWTYACSDPAAWDRNPHPPGGFVKLVNFHPQVSQNSHFVGATARSSPTNEVTPTPHLKNDPIQVDSGDEVIRTDKRILWTRAEDVRMKSAWLKNSTDSINGVDRRNEHYWGDVVKTYNMTTPKHRIRSQKQAKDRWHKISKWTYLFHCAWLKARKIYTSGHSDLMWIEKAHKFYEDDNSHLNLGHFVLMDVWDAVKGEAKWIAYNNQLRSARMKKSRADEEDNSGEKEEDEVTELPRPMGQKKAKKAAFDAKKEGQSKGKAIDVEQLDKFCKVQAESQENRIKVLEVQQKLSSEKLEAARLTHLAAIESKEAKTMEAYNSLLSRDTGGFSDEEKAEHLAALKCMRQRLFPTS